METSCTPPQNGCRAPQFSAHVNCAKTADGSRCPLVPKSPSIFVGTTVGLGSATDADLAQPPRGTAPKFGLMSVVAKRLHGSRCHLVYTKVRLGPGRIVLHGDPAPFPKGVQPPISAMSTVVKRSPISAAAEHLFADYTGFWKQ